MEARTGWPPSQGQHGAVEKVVASGPETRLSHGEPLHDPLGLLVCYTVTVSPKDSREALGEGQEGALGPRLRVLPVSPKGG